jgi:hypothetical protein
MPSKFLNLRAPKRKDVSENSRFNMALILCLKWRKNRIAIQINFLRFCSKKAEVGENQKLINQQVEKPKLSEAIGSEKSSDVIYSLYKGTIVFSEQLALPI